MSSPKRKRSPNWLQAEKLLLLGLVEEHFAVIENKQTDGVSVKKKLAEWQSIESKYNSQTMYSPRSAEHLKIQWENMKKQGKKEEASYRIDRIKTGGGPPKPKKEDPVHKRIIQLIEPTAMGLFNPFDGDYMVPAVPMQDEEINDEELSISGGPASLQDEVNNWGDYTPAMLKTPVSLALKPKPTIYDAKENATNSKIKPTNYDAKENATNGKIKSTNDDSKKNEIKSKKIKVEDRTARRRPTHTTTSSSLEQLHKKKIEAIELQKDIACQERDGYEERSKLEVEILKEKLKQEKIRTIILLLDVKLKKKQLKNLINNCN